MRAWINNDLCAGTDLSIVNAARRSFDSASGELLESDRRLINFLVREGHWLPFRHPQLSFSCEAPVFVARQLGKHQVGMSWSEVSRRYKTNRLKLWEPEVWRQAPENAKQGTGPSLPVHRAAEARKALKIAHASAMQDYQYLLSIGVAPEQARVVLPQSMEVYWTWTGSLLAWLHLIKERSHSTAQTETRTWVQQYIIPEVQARFPVTWEAIQQHPGVQVPNDQKAEEAEVRV